MAKGKGKKSSGRKVARSKVTGRCVKKGHAKKHPKTTIVETKKGDKKKRPGHGEYAGPRIDDD